MTNPSLRRRIMAILSRKIKMNEVIAEIMKQSYFASIRAKGAHNEYIESCSICYD